MRMRLALQTCQVSVMQKYVRIAIFYQHHSQNIRPNRLHNQAIIEIHHQSSAKESA